MPKRIKRCFDDKLTFVNLLKAYERCSLTKKNKKEVLEFSMDLESNLCLLLDSLKYGKYKVGEYYSFKIYEPKERLIMALPFKDRIVQQFYINEFIKPYITLRFINDSYAFLDNKGTHKAVYKLQVYMNKMAREEGNFYVLKCDIKKFFYSIDKKILFDIMKRYIRDKKLLNLTKILIFDGNNSEGIPIGNLASQWFANIYLNELDYYIKYDLRVKYYVRYCDDFVLLCKNKKEAIEFFNKIKIFLFDNLKLELNVKSRYYPNKMGINFGGYIIYKEYLLLRKRSIKKIRKKVWRWLNDSFNNVLDKKNMQLSWNSFLGHSKHAKSYLLRYNMYSKIKDINELIVFK